MQGILGMAVFVILAWLVSENRRMIPWKTVAGGLLLQGLLALILLKVDLFQRFFVALNSAVLVIDEATGKGTAMVFGFLGGGPAPFEVTQPGASFILAFRALPIVLVISALSAVLFYWRVLPVIIRLFSKLLEKSLNISGSVGLGSAANIFVGMVEAPLVVRPYLSGVSRGELFALMSVGMATIAGTVMVLYANILTPVLPNALQHILIASVISAPACLAIAALMVPWRSDPATSSRARYEISIESNSTMDAITTGTLRGLKLYLNIIAMLIVFVALVSLVNAVLALLPSWGDQPLSMERLLGWIMAPLVWLIGIPWSEAASAGALMGVKTIFNEFLAYLQLAGDTALSERSRLIMTYALCGFANLGSLGIMIGGLVTLVPDRREEILNLGMKSIVAGTLSTLMTGAVVSLLI